MTIRNLKETQDKSQIFLISLTAFTPLFFYIFLRVIYDLVKYHSLVLVTGDVFKVAVYAQLLVLFYLGYWTVKVFKET